MQDVFENVGKIL